MQLALTNIRIQSARYFAVHILLDLVLYSFFLLVISNCESPNICLKQQDNNGVPILQWAAETSA